MAWYQCLWPFGKKKAVERKKIEEEFQNQLQEAYKRRGDLEDATRKLREDREQREAASLRPQSMTRPKLVSRPSFQE